MRTSTKGNVWLFMLIAFGWTWLFWVPEALIGQGLWAAPAAVRQFLDGPLNLADWGPLIAAVFVTWGYEGLAGLKVLLKRLSQGPESIV